VRDQLRFGVDDSREVERLAEKLGTSWPAISRARDASDVERDELTVELAEFVPSDTSIVVFGSLARRELTSGSDLDWALLLDGQADPQHHDSARKIRRKLEQLKRIEPGATGAFGGLTNSHDLIHKIGGLDDTNVNLTQRNLLLLESVTIGDGEAYDRVIRNVLRRYIEEDLGRSGDDPYRVPRFLLNDIARYWRTLAVDFAQKRRDREGAKWALRTAKLRMSRKLIYAAGLMICYSCTRISKGGTAEARQVSIIHVVKHLETMVAKTPLDILAGTILDYSDEIGSAGKKLFGAYDVFLAVLDDPDKRTRLEKLAPEAAGGDRVYEEVRQASDAFHEALTEIFFDCDSTPIPGLTRKYGVF
jgi:predicted nucleotidyltransferase